MTMTRGALALLSASIMISIFAQGCAKTSSNSNGLTATDGGIACDPSQCGVGNECISDGKETKCRRPCEAQVGEKGCAFNWTCKHEEGAEKPFCVLDNIEYTKQPGQWGTSCNPKGGLDANPDCDFAQNFWCYGTSPTDAQSFCTQYQCQTDADCRGGWHCGKVNKAPNVGAVRRSQKLTTTICLPRAYCAPCSTNVDCGPLANGTPQVCVTDTTGEGKYCTSACQRDENCALDARCLANDEAGGEKVCTPRSGVCKGDGSLCSPCTSDDDCPDGLCISAPFSTEKFCSARSKIDCVSTGSSTKADCPKAPDGAPFKVGCSTSNEDPELPQSQCFGIVNLGGNGNVGCWTKSR